jgi:nitroreductase
MDTKSTILSRRSIRKFKKDNIPDDIIESWIRCGMHAPSAGNEQPWHFIIIKNSETLNQISRFHNHAQMLSDASIGILICIEKVLEKHPPMAIQDCSAATQNILLAVHEKGYGAVWLGVYPREQRMKGLKNLLNIPGGIIPFSLIAIGIPDEQKETEDRFKMNRIHIETW